jgi:hypothetical protein
MKFIQSICFSVLACSALSFSQKSFAGALEELSVSDQEKVKNEQQVAVFHPIPGEVWPKAMIYQYVKSTPEEAAAVFADYARHCSFFPDCKEVKVVGQSGRTSEVKYKISLPFPLISETYTVFDTLSTYDNSTSYQINWKLKEETSKTKRSVGSIRFEVLGQGTLIAYTSMITPNIPGAGLFIGQAKDKVQAIVSATTLQIVKERTHQRDLLDTQIQAMRAILEIRAISTIESKIDMKF